MRTRLAGAAVLMTTAFTLAAPPADLVVWSGDKPQGKTWARGGPKTGLAVVDGAGRDKSPKGLVLTLDGAEWKGVGLNWKGWFPADAADDASGFAALTFDIRQESDVATADLTVELADNVKRPGDPPPGNGVRLVADGIVAKLGRDWQRVSIPLERFAKGKPLRLDRLWEVRFSHAGKEEATYHLDRIAFTRAAGTPAGGFPATPAYQASARVEVAKEGRRIPEEIYGVAGLTPEQRKRYGIPVSRWGGNRSSRYNWRTNCDNAGADWYFLNGGTLVRDPADGGYVKAIRENQAAGQTLYLTVPMLGWGAKDATSYGFSVKKYGPQKAHEPGKADVGNGIRKDGKPVTGNDPKDTSVPLGPKDTGEAVALLVRQAGPAEPKAGGKPGVRWYALDNEPMLWHETHRDVFPGRLGYDELWKRTVAHAEAIKAADPTAKVAGFCSWGWTDLFSSAADAGDDNYATQADRKAHGGLGLAEWYIKQCGDYRREKGRPLVDVFDFHWYPQGQVNGQEPYQGKGMDPKLNALRLRSVRDLWDPEYPQESWIRDVEKKPTALLRRVREWIARHNPGMQVSVGEYNFGGADNVTGGLAQADALGVLAREGADLAFMWTEPEGTQELAFKLFRDYDGAGGRFGDTLLQATSDNPDLSVHSAQRSADKAVTVVLINKSLGGACECRLDLPGVKGKGRLWRFDPSTGDAVVEVKELAGDVDGSLKLTLPAASASVLVVRE